MVSVRVSSIVRFTHYSNKITNIVFSITEEATVLIGAHTIGLLRNTFGTPLPVSPGHAGTDFVISILLLRFLFDHYFFHSSKWVQNGRDFATPCEFSAVLKLKLIISFLFRLTATRCDPLISCQLAQSLIMPIIVSCGTILLRTLQVHLPTTNPLLLKFFKIGSALAQLSQLN